MIDSFVRVREKTTVLFAYGFLLMKQQNLQEARLRLANGLQTHYSGEPSTCFKVSYVLDIEDFLIRTKRRSSHQNASCNDQANPSNGCSARVQRFHRLLLSGLSNNANL